MRSRASLPCTYTSDHTPMSSEPPVHSPLQSDPTNDVEEPPRTPEISQRRETPSPAEPICISQAHDPETSSLSHRVRVLEQLLQQSEHSNRQTSSTKDLEARLSKIERRIEGWPYDPRPPDKSELRIKLPRPHLRAEHEKTRLFGKTHWVHSLDQVTHQQSSVLPSDTNQGNSSISSHKCNPGRTPWSMASRSRPVRLWSKPPLLVAARKLTVPSCSRSLCRHYAKASRLRIYAIRPLMATFARMSRCFVSFMCLLSWLSMKGVGHKRSQFKPSSS